MSEVRKPHQTQTLSSGDQALFSGWDSLFKLHGYRANGGEGAIHHQFHLADPLGRSNRGIETPHITHEAFRYLDGREVQPSWFAVTESWPPFPKNPTVPYKIGGILGTKFESFARETEQLTHELTDEMRTLMQDAAHEMGYSLHFPLTMDCLYKTLTEGSYIGIADEGKRSASSYNFEEIEDVQRKVMFKTYAEVAGMAAPEDRDEVKTRFRQLVDTEGDFYQLVRGKDFPELAVEVFEHASKELERISGVSLGEIKLGETSRDFRLIEEDGTPVEDTNGSFIFLDWYLQNRELYDHAHNEVSEELSQKGENPIQSLATNKGETPFWVIIDGQKHKLYLSDGEVRVVRRDGDEIHEDVIPLGGQVTNRHELAEAFASHYEGKAVSVMPTAIGLVLNYRAENDLLLPEHGSHYIPQVNKVYERMMLSATKEQAATLLPQRDIVRVHPHALSALPEGRRIKLPGHLRDAFPKDEDGFTATDVIKETWKDVVEQRKSLLERATTAGTTLEKARVLFEGTAIPGVEQLMGELQEAQDVEAQLKTSSAAVLESIKTELDKTQMKLLGQISAYIRGQKDTRPEGCKAIDDRLDEIEQIRQEFIAAAEVTKRIPLTEDVLKVLVALRARQVEASADTLEYFDARPSLLGTYLLFGEEGVKRVIDTTEVYVEETPKPITKGWYSAEGNKIVVIKDESGENTPQRKRIAHKIAQSLEKDQFDTAMVLTPATSEDADFRVDQVCLDGSVGGMCGNGVRSVARFAHDALGMEAVRLETETGEIVEGFVNGELYGARLVTTHLTKETANQFEGLIDDDVLKSDGYLETITEAIQHAVRNFDHELTGSISVHAIASVSGEPHIVLSMPQVDDHDTIRKAAEVINTLQTPKGKKLFPGDINVSVVAEHRSDIEILTHERGGPGITGACGTGAASILSVIGEKEGLTDVEFKTPAGRLKASFDGTHYVITGGVKEV